MRNVQIYKVNIKGFQGSSDSKSKLNALSCKYPENVVYPSLIIPIYRQNSIRRDLNYVLVFWNVKCNKRGLSVSGNPFYRNDEISVTHLHINSKDIFTKTLNQGTTVKYKLEWIVFLACKKYCTNHNAYTIKCLFQYEQKFYYFE